MVAALLLEGCKVLVDFNKGGANRAPKFPMPSNWEYLLHYYYLSNNDEALKAVTVTLDNMAFGGIYDHLDGGFARYSTDMNWHVPHFEKMLYDNAQLVSLYSDAFLITKNSVYKDVVGRNINLHCPTCIVDAFKYLYESYLPTLQEPQVIETKTKKRK